jgi:hypothetical protein
MVNVWHLTVKSCVQSKASSCGVCGSQSGHGTGFSLSTSISSCHYLSTNPPHLFARHQHYIILQINPTRCTILFNICIYFSSLHVSGIHVPIIRRKLLYLCDTGICHCVWVASGLLVGLNPCREEK